MPTKKLSIKKGAVVKLRIPPVAGGSSALEGFTEGKEYTVIKVPLFGEIVIQDDDGIKRRMKVHVFKEVRPKPRKRREK